MAVGTEPLSRTGLGEYPLPVKQPGSASRKSETFSSPGGQRYPRTLGAEPAFCETDHHGREAFTDQPFDIPLKNLSRFFRERERVIRTGIMDVVNVNYPSLKGGACERLNKTKQFD